MRSAIRRAYIWINAFLTNSTVVERLIFAQHRAFPLPIPVYAALFKYRPIAQALRFYGYHVWRSGYLKVPDYWSSKECLYWHLWRQHDIDRDCIEDVRSVNLGEMKDGTLTFLELGFGTGKMTRALRREGLIAWNRLKALDMNPALCELMGSRIENSISIEIGSCRDVIENRPKFDALIVNGGVLMCAPLDDVNSLFSILPALGCRYILITQEGSLSGDIQRDDGTHLFDFKARTDNAYPNIQHVLRNGKVSVFFASCSQAPS